MTATPTAAVPFTTVIGLEVHVQLQTRTKLFCGCATTFGAAPNTQVCPTCLGLPGSLPVMNRTAFELAVRAALALGCKIAPFTKWDRKNYFYPDLPKGYQISQFDLPFSSEGALEVVDPKGALTRNVRITRVHLEEDAGKSMHDETAGTGDTRIDLNRAGTPLCEIVSEPDLRSPQEARAWLNELKLLLVYLGVSDCNMQEGSLRVDANVNLHIPCDGGRIAKTPIVEIKNMNSFRSVERALVYESARQYEEWQATKAEMGKTPKQTRGWDDPAGVTRAQRHKEESSDYRYFPEPDLVPVAPDPAWVGELKAGLPELPIPLRAGLVNDMGLSAEDAEVITGSPDLVAYFMEAAGLADAKSCANWIRGELRAQLRELGQEPWESKVRPGHIAELVGLLEANTVSVPAAKEVLAGVIETGDAPSVVVEAKGLGQISDEGELKAIIQGIVDANPDQAQQLRDGKDKVLGFFVGQAMKQTGGRADPQTVQRLVRDAVLG